MSAPDEIRRYILSVLVQDEDGIISRVSGMFTRRAFHIVSIASGITENASLNRITIVSDADEKSIEQITKQLNKLVQVLKVVRMEEDSTVTRALLLVKVSADNTNRPQIVDAAKIFRARVIDVSPDSVIIEATGSPAKLNALLDVLEPFGIRELIQSGQVALNRGAKIMAPKNSRFS